MKKSTSKVRYGGKINNRVEYNPWLTRSMFCLILRPLCNVYLILQHGKDKLQVLRENETISTYICVQNITIFLCFDNSNLYN